MLFSTFPHLSQCFALCPVRFNATTQNLCFSPTAGNLPSLTISCKTPNPTKLTNAFSIHPQSFCNLFLCSVPTPLKTPNRNYANPIMLFPTFPHFSQGSVSCTSPCSFQFDHSKFVNRPQRPPLIDLLESVKKGNTFLCNVYQ